MNNYNYYSLLMIFKKNGLVVFFLRQVEASLIQPVTTERSNSSLRFVKNVYRTTKTEDRLNALLLLFIHTE